MKSGKLRPLAVASKKRIAALPEVPTVIEAGFSDYEIESWSGVLAPVKTPAQETAQFARYFKAALDASEIKSKLTVMDSYSVGVCGSDFAAFIRKEYDETGRIIRGANIKAQ